MNKSILVVEDHNSGMIAGLATLVAIAGKADTIDIISIDEAKKKDIEEFDLSKLAETKLKETEFKIAELALNMQFDDPKPRREDRSVIPNKFRPINNKGYKNNNTYRRKH